jgi:hypothetical protein
MSEYTAEMAHAAAARGAAWLDTQCPDWAREIRLERLDLASATFCVLGQTAKCLLGKPNPKRTAMRGGYEEVRRKHPAASPDRDWAVEHGFLNDSFGSDFHTEKEMLNIAWAEIIRTRLGAQQP